MQASGYETRTNKGVSYEKNNNIIILHRLMFS